MLFLFATPMATSWNWLPTDLKLGQDTTRFWCPRLRARQFGIGFGLASQDAGPFLFHDINQYLCSVTERTGEPSVDKRDANARNRSSPNAPRVAIDCVRLIHKDRRLSHPPAKPEARWVYMPSW